MENYKTSCQRQKGLYPMKIDSVVLLVTWNKILIQGGLSLPV